MRRFVGFVVLVAALTACANDNKATEDLNQDLITNHSADTDVIINADKFPNLSHTCWEDVGFWTTTDRVAIIVYNDWKCPGSSREHDMVVLSGNPRAVVNSGG